MKNSYNSWLAKPGALLLAVGSARIPFSPAQGPQTIIIGHFTYFIVCVTCWNSPQPKLSNKEGTGNASVPLLDSIYKNVELTTDFKT